MCVCVCGGGGGGEGGFSILQAKQVIYINLSLFWHTVAQFIKFSIIFRCLLK